MEWTLLGTGTCSPLTTRGQAGYALQGPGGLALIDSGSGTLGRLAGAGLDYRDVEACLYTHRHPDHTADLVPLLFGRKYTTGGGEKDLAIWGPPGFPDFVRNLQGVWRGWTDLDGVLDLTLGEVPPPEEPFLAVGVEVRAWPVEHGDPGLAYRFRDPGSGGTLCYTGDSGMCEGLLRAAEDVEVLVIECSTVDERPAEGHLSPGQVAEVARETGARRVILTHFYPVAPPEQLRAACEIALGAPVELGEDGMSVVL